MTVALSGSTLYNSGGSNQGPQGHTFCVQVEMLPKIAVYALWRGGHRELHHNVACRSCFWATRALEWRRRVHNTGQHLAAHAKVPSGPSWNHSVPWVLAFWAWEVAVLPTSESPSGPFSSSWGIVSGFCWQYQCQYPGCDIGLHMFYCFARYYHGETWGQDRWMRFL